MNAGVNLAAPMVAAPSDATLRGKTAIVGIGETDYYKHGRSPDAEFLLALKATLAACRDAGISPRQIDGFSSYGNDRSDAGRMSAALGCDELRFSCMAWGGGGGGVSAAVGNAAAALAGGLANCVVVFRSLAQGQFQRYGLGQVAPTISGEYALTAPYGLISPAQRFAMKVRRFMHDHGVQPEALRAIAMASYTHAQRNPRAVMYGKPLTEQQYEASRWIVEPFHLFDCCMENDGAAAMIMVRADEARDHPQAPAYLLGAAAGADHRSAAWSHNAPNYGSATFKTVAANLYRMAGVTPAELDFVQSYENFTGGVLLAMVEHGLCTPDQVNEFFQLDNLLAPSGTMPLNTSGGNLAECYMHGLELHLEAVRQLRGQSTAQVEGAQLGLVIGGPMVTPVSSVIYGKEA